MKPEKQKQKYIFLGIVVTAAFVFAMPFFVFAQDSTAPTTPPPLPSFLQDARTDIDLTKLTPEQQKELQEFIQKRDAYVKAHPPTMPTLSASQTQAGTATSPNQAGETSPPVNTTSSEQGSNVPAQQSQSQSQPAVPSVLTSKVIIAGVPILIVVGFILYRIWKKKRENVV